MWVFSSGMFIHPGTLCETGGVLISEFLCTFDCMARVVVEGTLP